ncbi:hypothetical protein HAX54_016231 [Datura stramonium]|uniref:Uncharacterized protein n=1 Tax=Datura stramonium TaxID=4076 RepID=A0ABS8UII0_DATST|nr:hypothetical protein [Datura stramonium]
MGSDDQSSQQLRLISSADYEVEYSHEAPMFGISNTMNGHTNFVLKMDSLDMLCNGTTRNKKMRMDIDEIAETWSG